VVEQARSVREMEYGPEVNPRRALAGRSGHCCPLISSIETVMEWYQRIFGIRVQNGLHSESRRPFPLRRRWLRGLANSLLPAQFAAIVCIDKAGADGSRRGVHQLVASIQYFDFGRTLLDVSNHARMGVTVLDDSPHDCFRVGRIASDQQAA
jgi:hypothetical protein